MSRAGVVALILFLVSIAAFTWASLDGISPLELGAWCGLWGLAMALSVTVTKTQNALEGLKLNVDVNRAAFSREQEEHIAAMITADRRNVPFQKVLAERKGKAPE